MRNELVEIVDSARLVLSKLATNCEQLIGFNRSTDVFVEEHEDTKALGLLWNSKHDVFKLSSREMCKGCPVVCACIEGILYQ